MTTTNPASAAAAYGSTVRALPSLESTARPMGPNFSELVEKAGRSALDTMYKAEGQTAKAATGQATDITEVVTAISNAEVTLQTVVAIRDRVVQAYNEIMRMPI